MIVKGMKKERREGLGRLEEMRAALQNRKKIKRRIGRKGDNLLSAGRHTEGS